MLKCFCCWKFSDVRQDAKGVTMSSKLIMLKKIVEYNFQSEIPDILKRDSFRLNWAVWVMKQERSFVDVDECLKLFKERDAEKWN